LSEISRRLKKSKPAIIESVNELRKRGLVTSISWQRKVVFGLTDRGEALSWALEDPDRLTSVYKKTTVSAVYEKQPIGKDGLNVGLVKEHLDDFVPVFELLGRDLSKEADGIRPIFVIDYCEIFALGNPKTSTGSIKFMFDHKDKGDTYVLSPASVWEALKDLERLAKAASRYSTIGTLVKHPVGKVFLELMRTPPSDPTELSQRLTILCRRMGSLATIVELLRSNTPKQIDRYIEALAGLITAEKIKPLFSTVESKELGIDTETYLRCYNKLAHRRPSVQINNMVDSLNMALVFWLNSMYYRRKPMYFLQVTHSPISVSELSAVKWPFDKNKPETLIRTPLFMVTRVLCKDNFPELKDALKYVTTGAQSMGRLRAQMNIQTFENPPSLRISEELRVLFDEYATNYYERITKKVIKIDSSPPIALNLTHEVLKEIQDAFRDKREYAKRLNEAHKNIGLRLGQLHGLFKEHQFLEGTDIIDDYLR
jgi:hypothetical protein